MKKITQSLSIIAFLSFIHWGHSQISISGDLPQTYTQNFDDLGTTNVNWANNLTLPGWFYNLGVNGTNDFPTVGLVTNDGGSAIAGFFNLGSNNSPDRALGSSAGLIFIFLIEDYYGAIFKNDSSNTITKVDLSYKGEQWRDSTNLIQSLQFFYRVGGGTNFIADPVHTGWTPAPKFNFVSPKNAGIGQLDGSDPANQKIIQNSIEGLNIPPGESFAIRWFDVDDAGFNVEDHILGIDDVAITFSAPLPGVAVDLKKPKKDKKLKFKGAKGFNLKGFVSSDVNPVTKVSYKAFGGTNEPTNLVFTTAGKFKAAKGKLAKKGVDFIFQSTKTTRAGVGISAGASPVTLIIKVEGTVSNTPGFAFFTNIFNEVTAK
ncbi:MAG: hypothetical protein R3F23_00840 [Verrucomicrobiia bacterium]